MKCIAIAVLALLVACAALADQNPNLTIGLDTDPPNGVNYIEPTGEFDVYIVFQDLGPGGGMLGAAFALVRTFGGYKLGQTNLMGGLDFGDAEVGWALTAGADCVYPDANGQIVAAYVTYLYTGTPGTMTFAAHPTDGAVGSDCDNLLDVWIDFMNLGVFADPPESPVEARSWGTIKALYR